MPATSIYLDPVNLWRVEQFQRLEGKESLSAAVRELVHKGWDSHLAEATDRAMGPRRSDDRE